MNKHNLIQLGALAQKKFCMKEYFRIMEVASDAPNTVRVAVTTSLSNMSVGKISVPFEFDDVELIKLGSQNNFEFVWCGYSARENVLIIKDAG